jgi:hypothetical protein
MQSKRCFKCLETLPMEAFYKHSAMGDGRLNKCKECTKKDVSEHRLRNIERIRQYDKMRASQPHRMKLRKEIIDEWLQKHPDRRAAQYKVSNAIRDGKLKRQPCWVCGQKAEAHHPDYSRPLEVVWLCRPHHMQAHALVSKQAA